VSVLACLSTSGWRATSDIPVIKINQPNLTFRRIPPGPPNALPRHRLPADVEAAKTFRPPDAVGRNVIDGVPRARHHGKRGGRGDLI
jgi:hypothetical protein